jgi:hypothetical protein
MIHSDDELRFCGSHIAVIQTDKTRRETRIGAMLALVVLVQKNVDNTQLLIASRFAGSSADYSLWSDFTGTQD